MSDISVFSQHKPPLEIEDVRTMCVQENIPHAVNFHDLTQPTAAIKADFTAAYAMQPLPSTDLPESGGGAVVVFESPTNINNVGAEYHGHMVTSIADRVGSNLLSGVGATYVQASVNPNYRQRYESYCPESVRKLAEHQGISVISTSMGWEDVSVSFRGTLNKEELDLWNISAFVVDSAGNDGRYGEDGDWDLAVQKQNAVSHAPPLTVHVGAAAADANGKWHIEGYSSANSPTFVAPVFPNRSAIWDPSRPPEVLTGTSAAAPYVSGVLAALDRRYGKYLTREQILYALMATCERVEDVTPWDKKTPKQETLDYVTNTAGLAYNPEYAGFGVIKPYQADKLLSHMVALTQEKPLSITLPEEEAVRVDTPAATEQIKNDKGLYSYDIEMPAGRVLKTTLDMEFANNFGEVSIVSPSGTRLPLVRSWLSVVPEGAAPDLFGMSTSHGWAGEKLAGTWRVESTQPIIKLQMNQHHFKENDIIGQLDIPKLLATPTPSLRNAKPLDELQPGRAVKRTMHLEQGVAAEASAKRAL